MRRQCRGGDFWRRLGRQGELHALQKQPQIRLGFGVAGENEFASVGGRQMDVDHLQGGEFLQGAARCEAWGEAVQPSRQRDLQAVSEEGDEDMRLDPLFAVMEDRANGQIALQSVIRRGKVTP